MIVVTLLVFHRSLFSRRHGCHLKEHRVWRFAASFSERINDRNFVLNFSRVHFWVLDCGTLPTSTFWSDGIHKRLGRCPSNFPLTLSPLFNTDRLNAHRTWSSLCSNSGHQGHQSPQITSCDPLTTCLSLLCLQAIRRSLSFHLL